MIRAYRIPLSAMDEGFLQPFLQRLGHIPPEQDPRLADVLSPCMALSGYEFREGAMQVGYAIIKRRHHILADLYFGPVTHDAAHYPLCIKALKRVLRRSGRLILRVFPPEGAERPEGLPARFNWATSIVDISQDEKTLIQSFSPNHRQSIRKALSGDLVVASLTESSIAEYAEGFIQMFARRGIQKDPAEEVSILKAALDVPSGAFALIATQHSSDAVVGGGLFLISGNTCSYYQGFAARIHPPQPVQHLILWEAMQCAKRHGCTRFDLFGYSLDNDDAQLRAINDFKRWFRGAIVHYPPTSVILLWPLPGVVLRLIGKRF